MNAKQAKNIQIVDWLHSIGHAPTAQKGDNLWYLSPLRTETEASFKVNTKRNEWYDFGIGQGGDLVTLVCLLYNTSVSEALNLLSNTPTAPLSFSFGQQKSSAATPRFSIIEEKALTHPALVRYCNYRGIAQTIAATYCREVRYQYGPKVYFAVGFANDNKGWELRSPYFKGCLGEKCSTTINNNSTSCAVFEGFFDLLSFVTLFEKRASNHNLVVLNSTALVERLDLTMYDTIHCFLDNDPSGHQAFEKISLRNPKKAIDKSPSYRPFKDLNEYILGAK